MTKEIKIAREKTSFDMVYYQEVISIINEERYLANLNIILGNKIVHKIRFEAQKKPYKEGIGKQIATDFLAEMFLKKRTKKEKNKRKKTKVNQSAARKTANTLLNDLEIEFNN